MQFSWHVLDNIPESSRWLAAYFGRWRPSGRVKGRDEWEYFKENIDGFQRGAGNSGEADNYSSIQFPAFADHWNQWVASLGNNKPCVTYKSASHLQDAHKLLQRWARRDSTILPHADNIDNLQERHTSTAGNQRFINQFIEPENPTRSRPVNLVRAFGTQTDSTGDIMGDDIGPSPPEMSETPYQLAMRTGNGRRRRRANAKPRCRRCGKQWSRPDWKDLHVNNVRERAESNDRTQNRVLRHGDGNQVWDRCEVSPSEFEPNFPCCQGKMPRQKSVNA